LHKVFKVIGGGLGAILFLFLAIIGATYWFLTTKWKDHYSEVEMRQVADTISMAPAMTANFYAAYDRVYPNHRGKSLNQMSWDISLAVITGDEYNSLATKHCSCIIATRGLKNRISGYHSWAAFMLASGLEEFTTEEKCLDFIYSRLQLEEYSMKYFQAQPKDLTVDENMELVVRMYSPRYYEEMPELLTEKMAALRSNL